MDRPPDRLFRNCLHSAGALVGIGEDRDDDEQNSRDDVAPEEAQDGAGDRPAHDEAELRGIACMQRTEYARDESGGTADENPDRQAPANKHHDGAHEEGVVRIEAIVHARTIFVLHVVHEFGTAIKDDGAYDAREDHDKNGPDDAEGGEHDDGDAQPLD